MTIIDAKLIEDSAKIDIGIRYLQSQITYVINRYTDKNADKEATINKYVEDLAKVKRVLTEIQQQQSDLDKLTQNAEREINATADDIAKIMKKHNIHIDAAELDD